MPFTQVMSISINAHKNFWWSIVLLEGRLKWYFMLGDLIL